MRIIKFLFYLSVIVFPFGQLLAYRVPRYPEVRILELDIVVGLTTGFWILSKIYRIFRRSTKNSMKKLEVFRELWRGGKEIGLFVLAAVVSILVNLENYQMRELVVGSLYLVRFVGYAGLYFVVRDLPGGLRSSLENPKGSTLSSSLLGVKTPCVFMVIFAGVVSAVFGVIQFFLYPNLRNLQYLGWDPHYGRAFGTFLDPQFLGIVLVITLLLLIGQIRQNKTYIIYSFIVFSALILTFSRSSYLAMIGASIAISGILGRSGELGKKKESGSRKRLGKLGVLGAGAVILFYLFRPNGVGGDLFRKRSAVARIRNWNEAVEVWGEKPVFGVGFNFYGRGLESTRIKPIFTDLTDIDNARTGVDNSFLFVLATTGIVGLAAYLNMWKALVYRTYKADRMYIAIITALFIHASFNNTLFYPHIMWMTFVYFSYQCYG